MMGGRANVGWAYAQLSKPFAFASCNAIGHLGHTSKRWDVRHKTREDVMTGQGGQYSSTICR
jgi:hypothetical protein